MGTRADTRQVIIGDEFLTDIIPASNWIDSSAVSDSPPPRPFAVLRWGASDPAIGSRGPTFTLLRIWIHDEPGSYSNIESVQKGIKALLDFHNGKIYEWQSDGEDQSDPSYGTIFKISTFRVVGA